MTWPAHTWHQERQVGFEPANAAVLDLLAAVEKTAHAHPWSRRHFADSLASGHVMQMLVMVPDRVSDPVRDPPRRAHAPALPDGRWLLGYLVAMQGVEEAHLLNLTTVPLHQRQGWARHMLQALGLWACSVGAPTVWLEVRESNHAARALYAAAGFAAVSVRKGYYPDHAPDHAARRENAIVMRWQPGALH